MLGPVCDGADMTDYRTLTRLANYVELIESRNLDAFSVNLESDCEFLDSEINATHANGSTILLMAILARFRDETLELELTVAFLRQMLAAGSSWKDVRTALAKSIPCSSTTSSVNKSKLGQLLMTFIIDGLRGEGMLDEWAGGWLAYYLQGRAWNRMIEQNRDWAKSRDLTGVDFAKHSDYEFPVAMVALGARKDATPPWTREQGTARSYAIKSKDPILRYIVMYDEYPQQDDGTPKRLDLGVRD